MTPIPNLVVLEDHLQPAGFPFPLLVYIVIFAFLLARLVFAKFVSFLSIHLVEEMALLQRAKVEDGERKGHVGGRF